MPRWPKKPEVEEDPNDLIPEDIAVEPEKPAFVYPRAIALLHNHTFDDAQGKPHHVHPNHIIRNPELIKLLVDAKCPYKEMH